MTFANSEANFPTDFGESRSRHPVSMPLAWVMIGGLISSTLLSRLVTPVMYKLLAPSVEVSA